MACQANRNDGCEWRPPPCRGGSPAALIHATAPELTDMTYAPGEVPPLPDPQDLAAIWRHFSGGDLILGGDLALYLLK